MEDVLSPEKALVKVINDYINEKKGRSLVTLAKAAGVGYTTVRRIAQGECIANQETALAIIDIALARKEKIEFLRTYFPKIGKLLEESYPKNINEDRNDSTKRYFRNLEIHNFIFNLSATSAGATVDQIKRLCGEKGLEALDELVNHGILERDQNGRIYSNNESWALTNVDDALLQVKHSLAHFDKGLIGTSAAKIVHATGSVNQKTLEEINKLAVEFSTKVFQLKHSAEGRGDIPFYMDLILNLYDKVNYEQN